MTEFEINKAVADKIGVIFPKLSNPECYDPLSFFDGDDFVKFDPCNNAQQAWDIMLANDISIARDGNGYYALHDLYHMGWGDWRVNRDLHNEKPFVAAMLLFLEI